MSETTGKPSSLTLALGGAGFLVLAGVFLMRDLALPPAALLGAAGLVASIAALLGQPRRVPWLAHGALLALALGGGAWYLAATSPTLLPALALIAVGSIASLLRHQWRTATPASDAAGPIAWYAAGVAFFVASAAFYFQFLTLGIADESLARRLIPTVAWLAIGLALLIAARGAAPGPRHVGTGLVAVALLKALFYDSTHLQGPLRVTLFAAVGVLLLAGARLVRDRERA